jgi:hypothetical protein
VLTTLVAIVPSAGALLLFWIALRAILQADRRERLAMARMEAAQDRAAAAAGAAGDSGVDVRAGTRVDGGEKPSAGSSDTADGDPGQPDGGSPGRTRQAHEGL